MSPDRRRQPPTGDHLLGEALDAFLRVHGHGHATVLAAIWSCWEEIVGGDVAAHLSPRNLRGTTLVVAVDQGAWATQLAFLSEAILSGLAERLGPSVVERLEATVRPRGAGEPGPART